MLPPLVAEQVNEALREGNLGIALKVLDEYQDLGWHDLPTLNKKAVSALSGKLQENPALQQMLVSAMFSSNRTLRLFAKRLLQSLKHPKCIAKPLRSTLESYLRKTRAILFSNQPNEAAKRRAQIETLEDAFTALLKSEPEEFLNLLVKILPELSESYQRRRQLWKIREQMRKIAEQVFKRSFGHLGLSLDEAPRKVRREVEKLVFEDPEFIRLAREMEKLESQMQTLLGNGENVIDTLVSVLGDLAGFGKKEPTDLGQKLREQFWQWVEDGMLKGALVGLQLLQVFDAGYILGLPELRAKAFPLLQKAKQAISQLKGNEVRRLWVEAFLELLIEFKWAAVIEVAPKDLPEELTPEAILALKIGEEEVDREIDELVKELKRRKKSKMEFEEELDFESVKRAIAESLRTVDERVDALLNPPVVRQWLLRHFGKVPVSLNWVREATISPSDLLKYWSKQPDWQDQLPILREKATALLMKELREIASEIQKLLRRRMTDNHQSSIGEQTLEEQGQIVVVGSQERLWKLREKLRSIVEILVELNPSYACQQILDEAERRKKRVWDFIVLVAVDHAPSDLKLLMELVSRLQHHQRRDIRPLAVAVKKAASVIAEKCYRNWLEKQNLWLPNMNEIPKPLPIADLPEPDPQLLSSLERIRPFIPLLPQSHFAHWSLGFLVSSLYCFGKRGEVKTILRDESTSIDVTDLIWLAILRRDYELLPLLLRHASYWFDEPYLLAFFEALCEEAPQELPKIFRELLTFLVEETDPPKAKIALKMLEKISDRLDLFENNAEFLLPMIDSTIPQVSVFAMGQLKRLVQVGLLPVEALRELTQKLDEKIWSAQAGIAKNAVELMIAIGERDAELAPIVIDKLTETLSVNSRSVLELVIKGLAKIAAKHNIVLPEPTKEQIKNATKRFYLRLTKPLQKLLST